MNTRKIHNYMLWRMVFSKAPYLNSDFNLMVEKITTGVLRNYQTLPRWKFCLKQVSAHLPHAVGRLYVNEAFPKTAKENINKMVDTIKYAFKVNMNNIKWMDEKTRDLALEKFEKLRFNIGYPDFYDAEDMSLFNRHMNFTINRRDFYLNIENSMKLKVKIRYAL